MIQIFSSGFFFFFKRLVHNPDAAVQYSDDDNKKNAQLQDKTGDGCKYLHHNDERLFRKIENSV